MKKVTKPKTDSLRNLALVMASTFLLNGCTSLSTLVPLSHYEGPRTNGSQWKWGIGLETIATKTIQFTSDASARPVRVSDPQLADSGALAGRAGLGVWENVDVFLKYSSAQQWIYGFKIQWLGGSLQSSKKDDFILTTVVSGMSTRQTQSGDQRGTYGPGGHNWSSEISTTSEDYSLLVGYMVSDSVLIYSGAYMSPFRTSGKIDQKRSDDGSTAAALYSLGASGRSSGPKLGLEFSLGPRAWLSLEGIYADFEWSGVRSVKVTQAHLGLRTIF